MCKSVLNSTVMLIVYYYYIITVYWSYGACICYMIGGLAIVVPLLLLARVEVLSVKQA